MQLNWVLAYKFVNFLYWCVYIVSFRIIFFPIKMKVRWWTLRKLIIFYVVGGIIIKQNISMLRSDVARNYRYGAFFILATTETPNQEKSILPQSMDVYGLSPWIPLLMPIHPTCHYIHQAVTSIVLLHRPSNYIYSYVSTPNKSQHLSMDVIFNWIGCDCSLDPLTPNPYRITPLNCFIPKDNIPH